MTDETPIGPVTPPEVSEGFSYAQICALLGFDPASTVSLVITTEGARAISTDLIEPIVEVHDGE